jgi:acetylornithine/LysW-gamma-L-lysine aminotransferase
MLGVETKRGANRLLRDLALEHGVLALPAGRTVLRLLPPLIVDRDPADRVVEEVTEVMT